MTDFKVGYFVGSLATKSINRLLAKALVGLAPPGLHMAEIPFKDLPLYSYDYDANFPPVATAPTVVMTPEMLLRRMRNGRCAGSAAPGFSCRTRSAHPRWWRS